MGETCGLTVFTFGCPLCFPLMFLCIHFFFSLPVISSCLLLALILVRHRVCQDRTSTQRHSWPWDWQRKRDRWWTLKWLYREKAQKCREPYFFMQLNYVAQANFSHTYALTIFTIYKQKHVTRLQAEWQSVRLGDASWGQLMLKILAIRRLFEILTWQLLTRVWVARGVGYR